jgi:hypothetical protein
LVPDARLARRRRDPELLRHREAWRPFGRPQPEDERQEQARRQGPVR